MKDVVRVWKDGKHVQTEVRDYGEDLVDPKTIIVWNEKEGKKAPSKDEAIALFDSLAQDNGIN